MDAEGLAEIAAARGIFENHKLHDMTLHAKGARIAAFFAHNQ
jgi:hypothetical protein